MKTLVFISVLALPGCSFTHTYVQGWPELKTSINVIPDNDIYTTCSTDTSWFSKYVLIAMPLACAKISLERRTCDIYIGETTTGPSLEHELAHCMGGDHGGRSQDFFNNWKKCTEFSDK